MLCGNQLHLSPFSLTYEISDAAFFLALMPRVCRLKKREDSLLVLNWQMETWEINSCYYLRGIIIIFINKFICFAS